jgi:site-specific recombinase XerD
MPGHHAGRIPPNKGRRCPADPPSVDEIVAVMRQAGDGRHGRRMRGLIVVLWPAGLRIHEALTLTETDLNEHRGSLLIRHGKGDRHREVGMNPWGRSVLNSCMADRASLPTGPLFCVIDGPTRGRAWSATAVRAELRHLPAQAGVSRRFAPHQRRHGRAVGLLHRGFRCR